MKPLPPLGRATRTVQDDGAEVWRLPATDAQTRSWLTWMGQQRVGGFVESGEDAHGLWLTRRFRGRPLHDWMQTLDAPMPWRDVVVRMQHLARLLAHCEEQGQFPGPIHPHNVLYVDEDGTMELLADAWIAACVGGPLDSGAGSASLSSRWMAPEHAAGAPPSFASNRYVVGLFMYRLLANEHPFGGMGLRLAVEQAQRGAPPMREAVAMALPPGLQSVCLQLLEADPSARPARAQDIVDRLAEFLDERRTDVGLRTMYAASVSASAVAVPTGSPPTAAPPPKPSRAAGAARRASPWPRRLFSLAVVALPLALGTSAAIAALAGLRAPASEDVATQRSTTSVPVPPSQPLAADGIQAEQCATCHPSQIAQWHRSVMGHSAKSPLFQALEIVIQEQVGRSADCPHGAGILREADAATACTDATSKLPITGSGGALWCVNCHVPLENADRGLPPWNGTANVSDSRRPLRDLYDETKMEGIGCAFCHQVHGPVQPGNAKQARYEGNPTWTSTRTGETFFMRPEDVAGIPGIANSGYFLDAAELLVGDGEAVPGGEVVPGGAHRRPSAAATSYLRSSEFCGSCHDVRLFGADAFGAEKGERFKRLRNAYTEWVAYGERERGLGRAPASCQDCHMSLYPGICERGAGEPIPGATALARACPPGTHFSARAPGTAPELPVAAGSATRPATTHYFTGVDVPLTPEFDAAFIDQSTLDGVGIPLGARQRRDLLLGRTFRFEVDGAVRNRDRLDVPVVIENVGGGHRVPAGFSQEREFWVHLLVKDGKDAIVYEVGRIDRDDEDLRDKIFDEVGVDDTRRDGLGRPLGLFGADVRDGPDVPEWSPDPLLGGTEFRGRGLVNLQNGFLRCVRCIGTITVDGRCEPTLLQRRHRADRFEDGAFDIDTGTCDSNLTGPHRFFETYFPVGSLDAERGVVRGPDAIIDTRSAPPGVPLRYVYDLFVGERPGPLRIEARLMFRAFPPFLIRGFAEYEKRQADAGLRPSGPLVTPDMLARLEAVELHRVEVVVP